jgi:SAM-dependent methyltransferase
MDKRKINYQGISALEVLVDAKNYNKWIADEIQSHISFPAIEIGAGTGNLTVNFLKTKSLYVTDQDTGLISHLKKRFEKYKNVRVQQYDVIKKPGHEFKHFFSTVFAINVLEHIKDDERALENIHQLLKKDGKLVLLVPAKKIAYTKLDRELGHFRRYEKQELIEKLTNAGYQIEKIYFFNIVGLISWYIRDKVKRKNIELKPYHIALFDKIVPILRYIESKIAIPVGISLIVVARKI